VACFVTVAGDFVTAENKALSGERATDTAKVREEMEWKGRKAGVRRQSGEGSAKAVWGLKRRFRRGVIQ